jgi:transcriptional regulator with XRE-family HTH domain
MSESLRVWVTSELNRLNWTHEQLAEKAGVSRGTVSNVLRGDMPPSADFCIKIAPALDTPPEQVLRLAGLLPPPGSSRNPDDPELQQLIELIKTLPQEKRQQLSEYVRFLLQSR